mmetsp:Transcript_72681/g.207002  ORF Transcript_72681/g.207002 Transcript_72681/m.207002 type:complete len:184 (-) Transcript_72681:277-828(-)
MSAFECDKATPMCPPLRYITDEPDISTARNNRKRRTENMMRSTHVFDRNSNGSLRRIAPVRRIEHRAVPFQEPMELDAPASTRSIESIQSLESLGSTDPTPKVRDTLPNSENSSPNFVPRPHLSVPRRGPRRGTHRDRQPCPHAPCRRGRLRGAGRRTFTLLTTDSRPRTHRCFRRGIHSYHP